MLNQDNMETQEKRWTRILTTAGLFLVTWSYGYTQDKDLAMVSTSPVNTSIIITGKVLNYDTHEPVRALIIYKGHYRKSEKTVMTDVKTGRYLVKIPAGDFYNIRISAVGHEFLDQQINTQPMELVNKIETDYYILPEK